MPRLYNTTSDSSQPIDTLAELIAAMPADPRIPSIYSLDDVPGFIVRIVYGSPVRNQSEVCVFTASGVDKDTLNSTSAATDRFLAIARHAF